MVWIIVGHNHYDDQTSFESTVTLMSEEAIANYPYDNSTDRGSSLGSSHWGNSGLTDATYGVRPFLNDDFYGAFSQDFKDNVALTELISVDYEGNDYTTDDRVFIFSEKEVGGEGKTDIGDYVIRQAEDEKIIPYFDFNHEEGPADKGELNQRRGVTDDSWTRSPLALNSYSVAYILYDVSYTEDGIYSGSASKSRFIRPVVNLSADVLVLSTPDEDGVYEIVQGTAPH